MKKLVSLLLAVAIIASMAVSVFAVVPIVEEPKKEEPKVTEPKKEEPKKEEPKVEPKVEVEPKKSSAGAAVCIGVFVAGCIVGAVVMYNAKKKKKAN